MCTINSEPLHRKSYYLMFEELNIDVPEDLYASFTGMATMPIWKDLRFFFVKSIPQNIISILREIL